MAAEILLVTDQPDIGQFWAYTLRQRGHACIESTVDEQIAEHRHPTWNAVLIDLYGSETVPIQLCETLHSRADGPILLLWDAYDEASILSAYAAGASEVLQRPISPLLLAAKLESWLRRTHPTDRGTSLGRTADSGR